MRIGDRMGRLVPVLVLILGLFAHVAASGGAATGVLPPIPGKIHPRLAEALAKRDRPAAAWVFFDEKPAGEPAPVTERALARRARAGYVPSEGDRPISPRYLAAVERTGAEIRTRSRWLNAVSVTADRESIERIAALPFVVRIQEVAALEAPPPPAPGGTIPPERPGIRKATKIDYGSAFYQLDQMNAIPLLEAGYSGAGVHVLMLDSGFYTGAPCFSGMDIRERRDFVHDDGIVSNETPSEGFPINVENHGSSTLSVIGGYDPGTLVGPGYGASYYLAKTEDSELGAEYPEEEDFWIEGIEWGESLGVDVASSSVGYIDWYEYADMTGDGAVISIGAQAAVERGLVVVNSQGNEANASWHYLIAPADAPGVIAVGAVTINGDRASFSSFGPTADGRIKPDVSAMGFGVAGIGNPRSAPYYSQTLSGTSFSCPLVGGAAALLLEVHPSMTPGDVMEALKATASQASAPDTALGWGIVDVYAAALRPLVRHDPAEQAMWNGSTGYDIFLSLSLYPGFDSLQAVVGNAVAFTDTIGLLSIAKNGAHTPSIPDAYTFFLPAPETVTRRYFFRFVREDTVLTIPDDAPADYYEIGDATPPVIVHVPIPDWPVQEWPPEVRVTVTDNASVDDDSVFVVYDKGAGKGFAGTFPLARVGDSTFAGSFPGEGAPGESVEYSITAVDLSGNRATLPASGIYDFELYSIGYALHQSVEGEEGPSNPFLSGAGDEYPIFFDMPVRERALLRVCDVAGRSVGTILDAPVGPGKGLRASWDGKDEEGRRVSSGVYFLRFEAGSFSATRKFIVIR
ncbi:MAG: S8 family serine peptidase [Candidatus Eisenbacteria bacterium]